MFKNKFILGITVLIFAFAIFYSLKDSVESFETTIKKERENYEISILNDQQNIILDKANFKGFSYFEPNEKFVFDADFQTVNDGKAMVLMTDSSTIEMQKIGVASFEIDGKKVNVSIFDEGEVYMLPFQDLTNGKETYGGGRYLNIPKENLKNNKIEIDFNKAHNFYCAYNPNFICPIPPKENKIEVVIGAGEKSFH